MNNFSEGIVLIDKPVGISSFGAVVKVRRASGVKRVGHAGTLDPMASGLLIIMIGRDYTRQADSFLKLDKVYEAELTLGATSTTADSEGEITPKSDKEPAKAQIDQTLQQFVGKISQTPPRYSALKINGQRAYDRARKGEDFEIKPRTITIYSIENVKYRYPKLSFTTKVSSGTYIRSLAEDIGASLGTGAYLSALRRTQIGKYDIKNALILDKIR